MVMRSDGGVERERSRETFHDPGEILGRGKNPFVDDVAKWLLHLDMRNIILRLVVRRMPPLERTQLIKFMEELS